MKQGRKIYDAAFKIRALELSNDRSNLSELARELGIKVNLLKYEMTDSFAQYYDNTAESFINFQGKVFSTGLVSNSCEDLIVDFQMIIGISGRVENGCTQADISFVCTNCGSSYSDWIS